MTTQREMKERLVDAKYQAEKEARELRDELREVKRACNDVVMDNAELLIENNMLKKEIDRLGGLVEKLDSQVRTLIFERDMRIAKMKELRKKIRDSIK